MKKILFAALAALAITSCSQNEEIEAPTQKRKLISEAQLGSHPELQKLQLKTWNPKVSYFTPIILKQLQWTK